MAQQWKIDINSIKQQMGPGWSDADVKAWLSNQGFGPGTSQKQFDDTNKAQSVPDQGLGQYADALHGLFPQGFSKVANQLLTGGLFNLVGPSDQTNQPAEAKPKAKQKPLPSPDQAAASTQESPFEQLAQALASEYLGQVQQLMPLTSGSGIFGPGGATNQVVDQAAAAIPGGGGWLQQQAAAEQQAAKPLQAAMSQVGEAQAQGAIPFAGAVANTGTANTQYLEAAPWQQILSELASETAYKAASTAGASAFGATPQNTPAFLQQIFKNLGLAGTASGAAGLSTPGTAAKGGAGSSSSALNSSTSPTG